LGRRIEAQVADIAPDDRPVILFDVGVVVLVPPAPAGEGDVGVLAVPEQFVVDELVAIVGIHAPEWEGQMTLDEPKGANT
jgi:hypothetical protein